MNSNDKLRLEFQYKALRNTKAKPLTFYDDCNHANLGVPEITKNYTLSSCYWALKHPITSMSLLRTLDNRLVLATGTFSSSAKVFVLSNQLPFIDETNIYELRHDNESYKVLDVDVHPNFFNIETDNGKVVTAASDGLLRLWTCDIDKGNNQLCQTYDIGSKKVNRAKFMPFYNTLASITAEGHLKITDIASMNNIMEMSKNDVELTSIAIHPSHNLIYTGDKLGYGLVWDLRVGKYICDFNNFVTYNPTDGSNEDSGPFSHTFKTSKIANTHRDRITRSDFDSQGVLLVTGSDDHFSFVWDLRKQKLVQQIPAHTNRLVHSKFTTNSSILTTASSDGIVKFWDWYSLTILNEIDTNSPKTTCVAYDQYSNAIFTADLGKKLGIFA